MRTRLRKELVCKASSQAQGDQAKPPKRMKQQHVETACAQHASRLTARTRSRHHDCVWSSQQDEICQKPNCEPEQRRASRRQRKTMADNHRDDNMTMSTTNRPTSHLVHTHSDSRHVGDRSSCPVAARNNKKTTTKAILQARCRTTTTDQHPTQGRRR